VDWDNDGKLDILNGCYKTQGKTGAYVSFNDQSIVSGEDERINAESTRT